MPIWWSAATFKAPTLGRRGDGEERHLEQPVDPNARPARLRPAAERRPPTWHRRRRRRPIPLRFDIEVLVPSTLRVENNLARLVASADLQLRGTYDRPLLFGRAEVDRGEVTFEGRRYLVTRGNIDFTNPTRIEPFLDVEAETRVRVPRTDLPGDGARGRHGRSPAAGAQFRSAAAGGRRPGAALQRRAPHERPRRRRAARAPAREPQRARARHRSGPVPRSCSPARSPPRSAASSSRPSASIRSS